MDLLRRVLSRWTEAKGKPYAAVFLDDSSQRRLIAWWQERVGIPLLANLKAHHMTIKFDPSNEVLRGLPIGEEGHLQVVGYAADERGQAVLIRSNVRSYNNHPHVTVAVAPGTEGIYSNDLLKGTVVYIQGPRLSGTIGVET